MKFTLMSLCAFLSIFPNFSFAQNNVALVKLAKGTFSAELSGKLTTIQEGQWIQQGTVIKTGDKSFVKLVFIDKSQINVGPKSEMKIEAFSKSEPGLLSVVKGQIRSQVTKDLLNQSDKSKLQVTTKTAAMGVRGTDFVVDVSSSGETKLDVIEGRVQFAPMAEGTAMNFNQIETVLNNPEIAIPVNQGMSSSVTADMTTPPVVQAIPPQELKQLEKALPMEKINNSPTPPTTGEVGQSKSTTGTSSGTGTSTGSIVPPGLSAAAVYNANAGASIGGSLSSSTAGGASGSLALPVNAPLPPPPGMGMNAPATMSASSPSTSTVTTASAPPPPPVVNDVLGTTSGGGPQPGAPLFFQPGTFFIDGGNGIKTDSLPTYMNNVINGDGGKTDVTIIVH